MEGPRPRGLFDSMRNQKVKFLRTYRENHSYGGRIGEFLHIMEESDGKLSLLEFVNTLCRARYIIRGEDNEWHTFSDLNYELLNVDQPYMWAVAIEHSDTVVFVAATLFDEAEHIAALHALNKPIISEDEVFTIGVFLATMKEG